MSEDNQKVMGLVGGAAAANYVMDFIEGAIPAQFKQYAWATPVVTAVGSFLAYKHIKKQKGKKNVMLEYALLGILAGSGGEAIASVIPNLNGYLGDIVRNPFLAANRTIQRTNQISNVPNMNSVMRRGNLMAA